jgi:hypothetical protein
MPDNQRTALCIGINDYPGTGNDLTGCVNDANDWATVLAERGYTAVTLLNSDATGDAIRNGIRELVNTAKYGDRVVITYSGHGTWVPDRNGDEADRRDEAICPYDLDRGVIIDDELYGMFSVRARGARIVMISDSCHSGTVSRFANFGTTDTTSRVRFLPPELFLPAADLDQARGLVGNPKSKPQRESALLLAGCRDFEYSYDAVISGRPNGAYTRAAINALHAMVAGSTYTEWQAAIAHALPSQRFPQTPQLYGTSVQRGWDIL